MATPMIIAIIIMTVTATTITAIITRRGRPATTSSMRGSLPVRFPGER
jgi:hypothetical protein